MLNPITFFLMLSNRTTIGLLALSIGFASCSKDSDNMPATVQLRTKMDYVTLTATTPYTTTFKDANGAATVDVTESNQRLAMFSELNSYMALVAVAAPATPTTLDVAKLRGLYANTGNYFADATLNTSGLQLRSKTAESFGTNGDAARTYIDQNITKLATISASVNSTATAGNPGRLGRYLVDGNGVEVNQVIQKGLIGGLLLDQIDNVLLSTNALNADNTTLVTGKPYTALEHNWDLAYGTLTKNAVMIQDYTTTPREVFLAGYQNEKNTANSPRVYMAFLKGRAAIINNDKTTLAAQADIIRTELEKTIALGATTYLVSWKNGTDLASKAHALGEGLGFIYSLRFCNGKYKADAAFSDAQLNTLLPSTQTNGAWNMTNAQADQVIAAVTAKFSL